MIASASDREYFVARFHWQRERLTRALQRLTEGPLLQPSGRVCGGLAREASGQFLARQPRLAYTWDRPWGWRWETMIERDVVMLMPAWLCWGRRAWRRRWFAHGWLYRLGVLDAPEGARYSEARWNWRWWMSAWPRSRIRHNRPWWTDRLGVWLERRGIDCPQRWH